MIIDTHQHLWDLDLFSYSWLSHFPSLKRSFRVKDYLEAAEGLGVAKSVHVEADVDEAFMLQETHHILSLAEQNNPLEGVVACVRPEKPDFEAFLEKIVGQPKLKGVRRPLHTQPDPLGQSPIFIENVRRLEKYNLSFDLCVLARQLPIAIHLVRQCPGVSFILDHCGVPQVKEKVLDPWRQHIEEISRFPNVVCKVSGLVAYADPLHWSPEGLRPFVQHVIDCFGWDRVMFGSDWPVCTLAATFRKWVDALTFLCEGAKEADRQKLFHQNAQTVYRLA